MSLSTRHSGSRMWSMKRPLSIVLLLVVIMSFPSCATAWKVADRPWSEDAMYLYLSLKTCHADFFNGIEEDVADGYVESVVEDIDRMDAPQAYYSLLSIAALAHDSHTSVGMDTTLLSCFDFLPVVFDVFGDDLVIVSAATGYDHLVGCTVRSVCGHTLDQIIDASRGLIPHDNDVFLLSQLKDTHLLIRQFYEVAGLVEEGEDFFVELDDGRLFVLDALDYYEYASSGRTNLMQRLPDTLNTASYYNAMYLPDESALLINYLSCAQMPSFPFTDFAKACIDLIEEKGHEKVIIDLRYNSGGDSTVIEPLVDGLEKIRQERPLAVYVLIGEDTFSSAVLNAIELKDRLDAVLVGRPTGGSASHYGELARGVLPNSRLAFTWSTKWFDSGLAGPLVPDIPVARSIADYRDGIDSDLAALGVL